MKTAIKIAMASLAIALAIPSGSAHARGNQINNVRGQHVSANANVVFVPVAVRKPRRRPLAKIRARVAQARANVRGFILGR